MSIETPADLNLAATRENLRAAIESLSKVVVDRCRGHDGYLRGYKEKMLESLNLMIKARSLLFSAVAEESEDGQLDFRVFDNTPVREQTNGPT